MVGRFPRSWLISRVDLETLSHLHGCSDCELAAIWITANDRKAVSEAAIHIEQGLAVAPLDHGESRDESQRIMFMAPLGVRYVVYPLDLRVVIVQFWTY